MLRRKFFELAFVEVGIKIEWEGKGIDEKGIDKKTGKAIIQVDPHSVKQWESDKTEIEKGRERLSNLKNKLTEVTRAIEYLERYAPKVSIFQKFSIQPEELPLDELKERVKKSNAELVLDSAIELQKKEDELIYA